MEKYLHKVSLFLANLSILVNTFFAPLTVYAQDATDSTSLTASPSPEQSAQPPTETPTTSQETTPVPEEVTPTPEETPAEIDESVSTMSSDLDGSITPESEPTPSESEQETNAQESSENETPPQEETPTIEATTNEENALVEAIVVENVDAASITEDEVVYDGTGTPTLQTDKADYAPTDVVIITGAGFGANQEYDLVITGTGDFRFDDKVKSDESGSLFYTYQLDGTYRANYKVEVLDEEGSTISEISFLDATVFYDGFGTGSTDTTFNEAPSWTEGGSGAEKRAAGSGNDSASPDGGRFAVIFAQDSGTDGYICTTINASGYTSVQLSYYWRGDVDANNGNDDGIVEFKSASGNSCSNSSGWTQLQNHDLRDDASWITQTGFGNAGFNNTSFLLRFRADGEDNEYFRVDGVSVSGDPIVTNTPTPSPSPTATPSPTPTPVTNPSLPQACGLDIALILDNSTSIDSGEMASMKSAMTAFTNALNGTPTQFSVSRFATTASVIQAFTANITDVNNAINGIPVGGGSTNWEDGLLKGQSTLPNRVNPDLVIFSSDGNPNRVDDGSSSVPEAQAVAEAKLVANSIKTGGARILALGIGSDLDTPNLQEISGPNVNTGDVLTSDVITTDFANLASQLATFASQTCGGTITARKLVDVDGNLGTTDDQFPSEGWTIDVSGSPSDPSATQTDANGYTPAVPVDTGTYSVVETLESGYNLLSAVCTKNQQPVGSPIENGVEAISVGANDIISCVFINSLNSGTITINKVLVPETDPGLFNLTITSQTAGTGANVGNGGTTGAVSLAPGDYTLGESAGTNTNLSDYTFAFSQGCDDGNGYVTLSPGENIVCTITNTRKAGSVKVNKQTDTNGDLSWGGSGEELNGTGSNGFAWSLDGAGSFGKGDTVTNVPTGIHGVDEVTLPANTHFVGWYENGESGSCTNPDGTTLPVSVEVVKDQTKEITLCNSKDKGTIVIVKEAVPTSQDNFSFDTNFDINPNQSGTQDEFELEDDGNDNDGGTEESITLSVLTGQYIVEEDGESGWALTDLVCDDDQSQVPSSVNLGQKKAIINVEADEVVTCTFTNQKLAKLIIKKDSTPNSEDNFVFSRSFGGNFELEDDGNDNNGGTDETRAFENLIPGSYTVTELGKQGWILSGVVCSDQTQAQGSSVTVELDYNETVTCTFSNTELGKIKGYKFNDKNADGDLDVLHGEFGLNGWQIFIDENGNETYDGGEPSATTSGWFLVDLGLYELGNLLPGEYTVCETLQNGWYNSTPVCQTTTITPGDTDELIFGNYRPMTLGVFKVLCENEADLPNWGEGGPNITSSTAQNWVNSHEGCELVSDWTFQYGFDEDGANKFNGPDGSNTGGASQGYAPSPWQTLGTTNGSGYAEIALTDPKATGDIWVREVLPSDEYVPFSYPPAGPEENDFSAELYCHKDVNHYDNYDRVSNPMFGETYYCVAFNALNTGDIKACKYDDYDGDGVKDENEPGIEGVTMTISGPQGEGLNDLVDESQNEGEGDSKETGEDGCVLFENLDPGNYEVGEDLEDLPDYTPSGDYENGVNDEDPNGEIAVSVNPGETTLVEFLNKVDPIEITLEKSADEEATGPGDIIFYTLKVKNTSDQTAYDVSVSDFTPFGFAYQAGTTEIDDIASGDPSIVGPVLTWSLGDLAPDQEVKVEYQMKAPDPLSEGTYTNIAVAYAYNRPSGENGAEEAFLLDLFVTEVNAVTPHVAAVRSESAVAFEIVRYTKGVDFSATVGGQVLGASTVLGAVLPASGSETYIILSLIAILMLGVWFKYLSREKVGQVVQVKKVRKN